MESKIKLRREYLEKRNNMDPEKLTEESGRICTILTESELFRNSGRILFYYPLKNEVDLRPAALKALKDGKRIAFPVTSGDDMCFYEVTSLDGFTEGAFRVMEPPRDSKADWESPLVIVPGVAFSEKGGRTGYGRGYYDRYLAAVPGCISAGVCFDFQIAEDIPMEEHDRYLDFVVSGKGIIRTGGCND